MTGNRATYPNASRPRAAGVICAAFLSDTYGLPSYSSAAPWGNQWSQLPPAAQQQVLSTAQALQDLPTRSQWFLYANWKDVLVQRFELSGFLRQDMQTASRALWLGPAPVDRPR